MYTVIDSFNGTERSFGSELDDEDLWSITVMIGGRKVQGGYVGADHARGMIGYGYGACIDKM